MTNQNGSNVVAMAGGEISSPQNEGPTREELIEFVTELNLLGESTRDEELDRELVETFVDTSPQEVQALWNKKQKEIAEEKRRKEEKEELKKRRKQKLLEKMRERAIKKLAPSEEELQKCQEGLEKKKPQSPPPIDGAPSANFVQSFSGSAQSVRSSDSDDEWERVVDRCNGYMPDELFKSVENAWAFRGHLAGRLRDLRTILKEERLRADNDDDNVSPELVEFLELLFKVLDNVMDKITKTLLQEGYGVGKSGNSPQATFKAMGAVMREFSLTQHVMIFTFGTRQEMLDEVKTAHEQLQVAWDNAEVWAKKRMGENVEETPAQKRVKAKKVSADKKFLGEITEILNSALSNQNINVERLAKRLMRKRGDLTDAKEICRRFAVNKQITAEVEEPDEVNEYGLHPTAWAVARSKRLNLTRAKFKELVQAEKDKRERLQKDPRQESGFGATTKSTNKAKGKAKATEGKKGKKKGGRGGKRGKK